jgi:PAS domain S-box-containing protein
MGRMHTFQEVPESLREQIVGMAEDKSGRFWIATSNHVLRVPHDKLQSGVVRAADVLEYGQADGLESTEGVKRSRSVVSDSTGRIWFSLSSGLSVVNPSEITDNSVPALPHIEAITADYNTANLDASVRTPPSPRRITFEYTGLSLAVPGRIRFRYFLEGFDSSWSQPVAAREAVYTNLGPGSYRFRLVASNSEGLWNGPETAIALNVAPAYYQTYWFRLSCFAAFIALLWALHRWRIHQFRGQEKRLRDVVETIPAMTFTALSDGSCTFVNKRWTEYTGLSVEQSSGAGWQRAVHPEDLGQHSENWRISVATGRLFEGEARFRRAAVGDYRWFLVRGVPLRGQHGNIVNWYGTLTDIEDRKRAEVTLQLTSHDLQDSKAKLEEAQRITHVGYWEWDLATGCLIWSDETYRIFGLRPQERPMNVDALREMIHPEDRDRVFREKDHTITSGVRYDVEHRIVRPSGEVRVLNSTRAVKKDESGRPTHFYGTVQDITDRKRAEEALQRSQFYISEGQRVAHMGCWALDATGFSYWSPGLFQVHGLDPLRKPPTVEEYLALVHPEDRAFMKQGIAKMLDDHRAFDFTKRFVRPDGKIRHVRCVGVPVTEGGIFQGFLGTGMDVTEQERLTEELRLSEHYLSEGQRLAHMGSWAFNPSGFFSYWSRELLRIYGLDPAQEAPSLEEYLALIHPQDREFMRSLIKKMVAEALECDVTKRIVRPDGEIRYIRCVGVPVVEDGTLQGIIGTAMDVTEHELLTQELRRREAYLADAQRLSQTGSFGWRPDSGEIVWSDETYRIFEYDHAVKPTIDLVAQRVHPEDRPDFLKVIESASAGATEFEHTYRLLLPGGSVKHVHALAHALQDASGNREFVGAVTDITSIKRAEEELRKSEAYLAEAQRLTHTGSWAWNVGTDELFWSEEIFRIYELDPVKLKPAWSLILDRVHPDDRPSLLQRKKMESTQTEWAESEADFRIVVPDGKIKHLHSIAHPVMDGSGQIVEVIGTVMDVTERKRVEDSLRRSESHLAEAQKLTHTASWAWRVPDRKTVHLSEEWYHIYGFDPAEGAPTWEEFVERVHPEDRLKFKGMGERVMAEKVDYDQEFRILLPNGRVKWIHTVGHPVLSDAGALEQFVGSSTDITERKSAEQEREKLRQLEAELAHINRVSTLGEMAASLAHEIKQPIAAAITSANSCIEWLAHEPPNLDRARAAAARIDKYGNRAAEIIDRIRSFYRKSPSKRELVNVNGIVQEMLTLLNGEATRHSVAMRMELAAELPEVVADRVQLQQVFMNLMLNGIEAMADSGGELTVKSELQDGQLQFSVSDTGVGLPTEKMDQIFSAFFTTKPHGSGMGLAISRSIVESHGGRLWVAANGRQGATFNFTLPMQTTESSPLVA